MGIQEGVVMVEKALGALQRIKTSTILRSVPVLLLVYGGHQLLSPASESEDFLIGVASIGLGVFLCRELFRVEEPEEILEEALKWVRGVGIALALAGVFDFADKAFGWREYGWTSYAQSLIAVVYGSLVSARAFPLVGRNF